MGRRLAETPRFLQDLDEDQARAVQYDGGPLAVLAGPGSGKTRVIVHRVARLIAPREEGGAGADPRTVLALAFTIKSADEMRERLERLCGSQAESLAASTCHSFGNALLRKYGDRIGLPARWEMMDAALQRRLLRSVIIEQDVYKPDLAGGYDRVVARALSFISRAHTESLSPGAIRDWAARKTAALESADLDLEEIERDAAILETGEYAALAGLLEEFDRRRLRQGFLLYDDFINLPIQLLEESQETRTQVRGEFRHIVVDEFQDWNPAQIRLLRTLAPEDSDPDVCVVGDDDQSIYAFRGADDRAFERFSSFWEDRKVIALSTNYRSAPEIIAAANHIIEGADDRFDPEKTVSPPKGRKSRDGEGVVALVAKKEANAGVAIGEMLLRERARFETPWHEIAVIGRTWKDLVVVAEEFELLGIPICHSDLKAPEEGLGVATLLRWLRLLADPSQLELSIGLLLGPPASLSPETAHTLSARYRRRLQDGDERNWLDWLGDEATELPGVRRFLELFDRFHAVNSTESVDALILVIIEEASLLHLDAVGGRPGQRIVAGLAAFVDFARGRLHHLQPTPDARAFVAYYDDLGIDGRAPAEPSFDRLAGAPDPAADEAVGVRFLTAHGSKGLEFDTVALPHVQGPHGYPKRPSADEGERLPEDLIERQYGVHYEEERRLFYVACTRAERKLLLVGKKKKSVSKDRKHYFDSLTHSSGLQIPIEDEAEILAEATHLVGDALDELSPDEGMTRALTRVAAAAKNELFSLVHDVARVGVTTEELASIQRQIEDCARRLAIVAHVRDGRRPPQALVTDAVDDSTRSLVERLDALNDQQAPMRKLTAPLSLSFSFIDRYRRCPACFYFSDVLNLKMTGALGMFIGAIVHRTLERFFKESRSHDAEGGPPLALDRLLEIGAAELQRETGPAKPVEVELEHQLDSQLRNFWETLHEPDADILEIELPHRFDYTCDGVRHRMTAKIDRIDRAPDGTLRIIDYKTGYAKKDLIEVKANDLQLGIYLLALQDLYGEAELQGQAEYWLTQPGARSSIRFEDIDLDAIRTELDASIRGILNGDYSRGKKCRGDCRMLGDLQL